MPRPTQGPNQSLNPFTYGTLTLYGPAVLTGSTITLIGNSVPFGC